MPQMPMAVLQHSRDRQQHPNPIGWPADWPISALLDVWDRAQEEIAALVPGAVFTVAEASDHNIMIDEPMLVTDSIRAVVNAVRDGENQIPTGGTANAGPVVWPLVVAAGVLVAGVVLVVVVTARRRARVRQRPRDVSS